MNTMLLHAQQIEFTHPVSLEMININAEIHDDFVRVLSLFDNYTVGKILSNS